MSYEPFIPDFMEDDLRRTDEDFDYYYQEAEVSEDTEDTTPESQLKQDPPPEKSPRGHARFLSGLVQQVGKMGSCLYLTVDKRLRIKSVVGTSSVSLKLKRTWLTFSRSKRFPAFNLAICARLQNG